MSSCDRANRPIIVVVGACLLLLFLVEFVSAQCVLNVPPFPLSLTGLTSIWIVTGCTQIDPTQTTFAQAVILDLNTGAISVYNPLILDNNNAVASINPTIPILPVNHIVGLWFSTNNPLGMTLNSTSSTTPATDDSLMEGHCENGVADMGFVQSTFTYSANCNAREFFDAARAMIAAGLLVVPPIGTDFQGNPCPTSRDFGVVSQYPGFQVTTRYLIHTPINHISQFTTSAVAQFGVANVKVLNQSIAFGDNYLLDAKLSPAINCTVWTVPDLTNNKLTNTTSVATNELQARFTASPIAFIPATAPMVLTNFAVDYAKLNSLRTSLAQLPTYTTDMASAATYCKNLWGYGAVRVASWLTRIVNVTAPELSGGKNLASYMIQRFITTSGIAGYNCTAFIPGVATPLSNLIDAAGNVQTLPAAGSSTATLAALIGSSTITTSAVGDNQDITSALAAAGAGTCTATTTTNNNLDNFYIGLGVGTGVGIILMLIVDLIFVYRKRKIDERTATQRQMAKV